jgi:hypothetical protein
MRRPKAADLFLCMILFVLSASVGKISTTSSDDNLCLFSITTLMVLPSLTAGHRHKARITWSREMCYEDLIMTFFYDCMTCSRRQILLVFYCFFNVSDMEIWRRRDEMDTDENRPLKGHID